MKTTLYRIGAFCAALFFVAITPACAGENPSAFRRIFTQNTLNAKTVITPNEAVALNKAIVITATMCRNVYPAPASDLECVKSVAQEVEKQFPGSRAAAKDTGLADVPSEYANEPLMVEVILLNAQFFGACKGSEFEKCMDRIYRAIPLTFDPHSGYISAEDLAEMRQSSTGSFSGVGMEVGGKRSAKDPLTVITPMEGSPAEKAGILAGDVIVGISKDGSESGMRSIETYANSSEAVKDIRGATGTQVRLIIERPGETTRRVFIITRGTIDTQIVKATLLSEGAKRYGVIHVRQFDGQACSKTEEAYKKLLAAAGKLDGLIVSVERDPGGYLHEAHCMLDLFLDAPSFVLMRDRDSVSPYSPCRRDMLGRVYCQGGIKTHAGDITNGLPILVMVNGGSASASEIFAAGMKHNGRAVIAGTPTFQKGSVQSIIDFPDGSAVKVTTSEYLVGTMTDWTPVQCLGVTPDIVFDRGQDPKDKDGKPFTECGLDHAIRSGGAMPNAPVKRPIQETNPALFAVSEAMLEAYKKHTAVEDAKRKKQEELLKHLEAPEKK